MTISAISFGMSTNAKAEVSSVVPPQNMQSMMENSHMDSQTMKDMMNSPEMQKQCGEMMKSPEMRQSMMGMMQSTEMQENMKIMLRENPDMLKTMKDLIRSAESEN